MNDQTMLRHLKALLKRAREWDSTSRSEDRAIERAIQRLSPSTVTDRPFIEAARRIHGVEGEIEVDDGAKVSYSDDGGAYVQAWVWVRTDETIPAEGRTYLAGAPVNEATLS